LQVRYCLFRLKKQCQFCWFLLDFHLLLQIMPRSGLNCTMHF